MLTERFEIKTEGSLSNTALYTYIIDYSQELHFNERPLILLCPGGGYEMTSDREGEILALQFLAMGYNAAILRYSCAPARYPTQLLELAQAMLIIKEHAHDWHVRKDQIFVQGCSAGGHLAASLGVYWNNQMVSERLGLTEAQTQMLRPAGLILCYPVISSGVYAHRGSFNALLGPDANERLLREVSLEYHVTADTPETFIWHTFTDGSVPVENSLMFINSLRKAGVNTEFHMYSVGGHGLSTADEITCSPYCKENYPECQSWLPQVRMWLERHTGFSKLTSL